MAQQENCVRVTRAASKKRPAESAGLIEERVVTKKRVVLGELSNLPNAVVSGKENQKKQLEGKLKAKTGVVKPASKVSKEESEHDKQADIDAKSDDLQMCGHYVSDIFQYLRQMEVDPKRRPLPDYIENVQKDVSTNMRGILVDWLVGVVEEYKLISDTLYIAVSYIDRYLSLNALNRQKLQLLDVSSMLIAS
ncbi:cyclin-A3-2-like [Hibiscus syriacus]|nr:cyclin-A3-2-like [Hibiscus syriacus]